MSAAESRTSKPHVCYLCSGLLLGSDAVIQVSVNGEPRPAHAQCPTGDAWASPPPCLVLSGWCHGDVFHRPHVAKAAQGEVRDA